MSMFAFVPFVFILSVASFRTESANQARFFSIPAAFVNSMATADQKDTKNLIDYAHSLIAEGEEVRSKVIKVHDDAFAAASASSSALQDAEKFLRSSNDGEAEALVQLNERSAAEAVAREEMDDAKDNARVSLAKLDRAQATMVTEVARIGSENAELKDVNELLGELMPVLTAKSLKKKKNKKRALLKEVDLEVPVEIDPLALQNVIELVSTLIEAGKQEAIEFTEARDLAFNTLKADQSTYNGKVQFHTHALGAKSVAKDILAYRTKVAKRALSERDAAAADKQNKDKTARDAQIHRETEEKRIDEEKHLIEEAIELLDNLVHKE